jgi:hypothetical protein
MERCELMRRFAVIILALTALRCGMMPAFAEPDGPRYYYVGPWQFDSGEGAWEAPENTVGLVDLSASLPKEDIHGGIGFFALDAPMADPSGYTYFGDSLDGPGDVTAWETATGADVDAGSVLDLLWQTCTTDADPTGLAHAPPFTPTRDGTLELHLGGHSLVRSREWKGVDDPSWPAVREMLRATYRAERADHGRKPARERAENRRKIEQRLGARMADYRIADWRELVPDDLRDWQPRQPETTQSDNFTYSDGAIGAVSSGAWTVTQGSINVSSNAFLGAADNSNARFETSVSSGNHYAQATSLENANRPGPAMRFAAAANTCVYVRHVSYLQVQTCVAGSRTTISTNTTTKNPGVLKIQGNGSVVTYYHDGVLIDTLSSSVGSTNTYGGICANTNGNGDAWVMSDLAPAGAPIPVVMRHRQNQRMSFTDELSPQQIFVAENLR